jgi:hypothetical protein
VRVTRLNVAGEIAVAIAVMAVLVYELIYSGAAARATAIVALLAGVALCELTIRWLRQHPGDTGRVQLAIALLIGGSFVLADRFPRTAFLVLCAVVAGFLARALAGLRHEPLVQ